MYFEVFVSFLCGALQGEMLSRHWVRAEKV